MNVELRLGRHGLLFIIYFGIPSYKLITRVRDNWSVFWYFNYNNNNGKLIVVLN